jgi:hypothetical protein
MDERALTTLGTHINFQGGGRIIENISDPIKGSDVANKQYVLKMIRALSSATTPPGQPTVNKVLIKALDVGTPGLAQNEVLKEVARVGEEFIQLSGTIATLTQDVLFMKVQVSFATIPGTTSTQDTFTLDVYKLGLGKPSERVYSNKINIGIPHQYDTIYIPNLKKTQSISISCTTHTGSRRLPYRMYAVIEKVF